MTNKPDPQSWPLLDNAHAPDVFADRVLGIAFLDGVIRLTFESVRTNFGVHPTQPARVVIGRLVMPLGGAEGLRDLLTDYIAKVRAMQAGSGQPPPQSMH